MSFAPTPQKLRVVFCCGCALAIMAALRPFSWYLFGVFSALMVLPYLLAWPIALRITREFAPASRMYRAWVCLTAFAAFSVLRHATDLASVLLHWRHPSVAEDLALLPIVLSLLCLLAAILLMWSSFHPLGMGTALRLQDWALLLFVPLLLAACFAGPGSFPHNRSFYRATRYLEYVNPLILAGGAMMATFLYRLSQQMGSGGMSRSLFLLVLYLAGRFSAFSAETLSERYHLIWLSRTSEVLYWTVPWLFPWALALWWQVTERAAKAMETEPGLAAVTKS